MEYRAILALLLLAATSAGCIGDPGPEAGQLVVMNNDDTNHFLTVEWNSRSANLTLAPGNRRVITLTDSPGRYTIEATVDGSVSLNETVAYSPGGDNGNKPAGPVINLVIDADRSHFTRSYD